MGEKVGVQTPCFLRVKIGAITWHTKLGLQIEGFFDLEQVDRQRWRLDSTDIASKNSKLWTAVCCPSRIKICFMTSLGCHNIEHLSQIHGRHLWIELWNSQNRNSMINKLNPFFQCSYTWRCKYLYMSK